METAMQSAMIPAMPMIPDIHTTEAGFKLAELAARSGLCKTRNAYDAFFVIGYGMELGIPPMTALRTIHVINNTPTCSGQAMLALIRRSGKVLVTITGSAESAKVHMKRRDTGDEYTAEWDMKRAKAAGVTGKDTWQKFPQQMLQWRAVSEAAVFLCSDIIGGLYTIEEIAPQITVDESGEPVEAQAMTITVPEPEKWHKADNGRALHELSERSFTAGLISERNGKGIALMEAMIAPRSWDDFESRATAAIEIKRIADERRAAAQPVSTNDTASSTSQQHDTAPTIAVPTVAETIDILSNAPDEHVITAPDSPFARPTSPVDGGASASTGDGGREAMPGTNSTTRGMAAYQAQQEQQRIDDFHAAMDRDARRAAEKEAVE